MLKEAIEEEKTPKEIVVELKEAVAKHNITEAVSHKFHFRIFNNRCVIALNFVSADYVKLTLTGNFSICFKQQLI